MPDINVTISQTPAIGVTLAATPAISIAMAGSGPPGPAGPAGGSTVTYTAGEALSSGRVVIIDGGEAFYFQPGTAAHAGRAFGVTATSASVGNPVNIQIGGEITDAGIAATADAVAWVGSNGQITATAPTSGLLQQAGMGITGTKIKIQFNSIIIQN